MQLTSEQEAGLLFDDCVVAAVPQVRMYKDDSVPASVDKRLSNPQAQGGVGGSGRLQPSTPFPLPQYEESSLSDSIYFC